MKLTITIDMDNDAFRVSPRNECQRIIHEVLRKLRFREASEASICDSNGNTVGKAEVTE